MTSVQSSILFFANEKPNIRQECDFLQKTWFAMIDIFQLFRNHMFQKSFCFPKDPFSSIVQQPTALELEDLIQKGDYIVLGR